MIKKNTFFSLFFFLLFSVNCFDYKEKLIIHQDLSGRLLIEYDVPLKKREKESLIAFLPISQEEIQLQLNQKSKDLKVQNFHFSSYENHSDFKREFPIWGKVSYEIKFEKIEKITPALLGNIRLDLKNKSVFFKRSFQAENFYSKDLKTSKSSKKIISSIDKLLGNHSVQFQIIFPKNWVCVSKIGSIHLGELSYNLPLKLSINREKIIWNYSISPIN